MATDFFDEDLAEPAPGEYAAAAAPRAQAAGATAESFHARQKKDLPEAQAAAGDEIERLRMRQQELERRKQEIIDQRHRIDLLERNKADLLGKLRRNAVLVVRQGEQASRAAAICSEAGAGFSRLHRDMEAINPDSWDEEDYEKNLVDALAKVDSAAAEYRAAMDRVASIDWRGGAPGPVRDAAGPEARGVTPGRRGFAYWLVAGFAFTLPAVVALAIVAVIFARRVSGA